MNGIAFNRIAAALVLLAAISWAAPAAASEPAGTDPFAALRRDLRNDRTALVAERMQFTQRESDAFWPIYRSYRAEVDKVTDEIVKLVLEYADDYPNVPDEKANEMVRKYMKVEAKLLKVRTKYLKKLGKVLPGTKVFRFAQLDNRLDLGIRVGLAAEIPLLTAGETRSRNR